MKKIFTLLLLVFSPLLEIALEESDRNPTLFSEGVAVASISNPLLEEISGLSFSEIHPNLIYMQTDSGGESAVYLLDSMGCEQGKIALEGITNRDWEDIVVGRDLNGIPHVYIAEIGDNRAQHQTVYVYRFPEPDHAASGVTSVERARLAYPGGARDAETLMIDPWDGKMYIVSKRDSLNTLYSFDQSAFQDSSLTILRPHFTLPFTMATGGEISRDGKQILIKNYNEIFYWQREEGESLLEVLKQDPIRLPYIPEPQGEAIGFSPGGKSFYTISEQRLSITPVLYRYSSLN